MKAAANSPDILILPLGGMNDESGQFDPTPSGNERSEGVCASFAGLLNRIGGKQATQLLTGPVLAIHQFLGPNGEVALITQSGYRGQGTKELNLQKVEVIDIGIPWGPLPTLGTDGAGYTLDEAGRASKLSGSGASALLSPFVPAQIEDPPSPPPTLGCTDPDALNYNPFADIDDGTCVYTPPPPDPDDEIMTEECTFSSSGDANGIFAFAGLGAQVNPLPYLFSPFSTPGLALAGVYAYLADRTDNDFYVDQGDDNYIAIDFGLKRSVLPKYLSLKNRQSSGSHVLTQVRIEGIPAVGGAWEVIQTTAISDQTANAWNSFAITTSTEYRALRVVRSALTTSSSKYLCLGEMEWYGTFKY